MDFRKTSSFIAGLLLLVYTAWWVYLALFVPGEGESVSRDNFSLSYGVLAAYGGILGLIIAAKWNGFKSVVGKALIFFSLGLLFQFLGQISYSIQFLIDHVENAYPSWGEIFFFSSMPLYILGVWYIGKASGSLIGLNNHSIVNKLLAFALPTAMVVASYFMFVDGTDFTGLPFLVIFLSFAYPLGQATFVSLAITAYILAGKVLGGAMKTRVAFILFSLVAQYVADSVFLYKSIQGTWFHADESEYLFALSYAIMTFAFIQFLSVFDLLKKRA